MLSHSLTLKPGKHGRRDTQRVRKLLDLSISVAGTPQCTIIQDFHMTEAFMLGPQETSTLCLSCHCLWIPTRALLRVQLGCEGCVRTATAHGQHCANLLARNFSLRGQTCSLSSGWLFHGGFQQGECFGAGAGLEQVLCGDLTQTRRLPEYFSH